MVRLSTTYEKVGDVSRKFFMLRGDEAYAHTTACVVSVDNYDDDEIEYYTLDADVQVHRGIGSSPVYLYLDDDESPVKDWTASSNVTEFTATGLKFAYGVPHQVYAVYKGNSQSLGSKSKIVEFEYDIPEKFLTEFDLAISSTQISSGDDLLIDVGILVGGSSTASSTRNRPILVYVDGEYYTTITTGNYSNIATGYIYDLSDGKHIITFEVERTSNINAGTTSIEINVGYNIEIVETPLKFITYADNVYKFKVTDPDDNAIVGENVSFMNQTKPTDSSGIATFTITNITQGTYHAEYDGSLSDGILVEPNVIGQVTLTYVGDGITQYNGVEQLIASIGENTAGVPLTFSGGLTGTYQTNSNGIVSIPYNGIGAGLIDIDCSLPNGVHDSIQIYDYLYNFENATQNGQSYRSVGELKRYNSYYEIQMIAGIPSAILFQNNSGIGDISYYPMDISIELASKCEDVRFIFTMNRNMGAKTNYLTLNAGDVIRCTYDEDEDILKAYVNDTQISLNEMSTYGQNMIGFEANNVHTTQSIKFKDLKVLLV